MANASSKTVKTFSLYLTEDEANTLATVLHKVGGHPDRTRRGHAEQVQRALVGAGAVPDTSDVENTYTGGIRFLEV